MNKNQQSNDKNSLIDSNIINLSNEPIDYNNAFSLTEPINKNIKISNLRSNVENSVLKQQKAKKIKKLKRLKKDKSKKFKTATDNTNGTLIQTKNRKKKINQQI